MKIVYFDLETTNIRPVTGDFGVEIISIGAVGREYEFRIFMIPPSRLISPGASNVHGITMQDLNDKYENYDEDTFLTKDGLKKLIKFILEERQNPLEEIVLVSTHLKSLKEI